jgi:hypothetical protein
LEGYADRSYEAIVEDLLHPERFPKLDDTLFYRYYTLGSTMVDATVMWHARWIYRMINTQRPLEEKMALFWHHVFATGWHKSENTPAMVNQIDMFRRQGLSTMRTILLDLSRDPAMLDWLDNNENHKHAPNENYGRELLELFSMGVGNYSEQDIKQAARAFTGWTFAQPIPLYPYGYYPTVFEYDPNDHDGSEKAFLGHTGRFNGEDIIDIIVRQPATAKFLSRHLYNFLWPTNLRSRRGTKRRRKTLRRSTPWLKPMSTRMGIYGRSCGCCSTRTSSKRLASNASRVPRSWLPARFVYWARIGFRSRVCTISPRRRRPWGSFCTIRPRLKAGIPVKSGLTGVR